MRGPAAGVVSRSRNHRPRRVRMKPRRDVQQIRGGSRAGHGGYDGAKPGEGRAGMPKTLFIDSTADIDRLWKQVHKADDGAVAVNMGPVVESGIPNLLAGYDTCIVDATYFNEATLRACTGLKHIVFLGTGAG